ncbi:MAG TPA: response regulator [Gemmatimonadales bacterium]|nr:response regulator [Gemmatimonadales bacterium]
MAGPHPPLTILWADDDPDDRLLIQEVLAGSRWRHRVRFVEDGEELLEYLCHRGRYADRRSAPRPSLILLDLNMPRRDGREVLAEIKADPRLRDIPVVVITTSRAQEDVDRSYRLGVSSYITKPASYQELVEMLEVLSRYWGDFVRLPSNEHGG